MKILTAKNGKEISAEKQEVLPNVLQKKKKK